MAFPLLVFAMVFALVFFFNFDDEGAPEMEETFYTFLEFVPGTIIAVGIWFLIAYFVHNKMINSAARSHTLERKENMRVYQSPPDLKTILKKILKKEDFMSTYVDQKEKEYFLKNFEFIKFYKGNINEFAIIKKSTKSR